MPIILPHQVPDPDFHSLLTLRLSSEAKISWQITVKYAAIEGLCTPRLMAFRYGVYIYIYVYTCSSHSYLHLPNTHHHFETTLAVAVSLEFTTKTAESMLMFNS